MLESKAMLTLSNTYCICKINTGFKYGEMEYETQFAAGNISISNMVHNRNFSSYRKKLSQHDLHFMTISRLSFFAILFEEKGIKRVS